MRSFRLDPYLWVHLAGLAMLPVLFSGCLLGLAVGEPLLSVWIEMGVLVGLGVVPILWMQLQRPFYIFSLVFAAIRPESLSDERLRLLRLFKTPSLKVVSAIAPLPLIWVLWQIYVLAPVASEITPLAGLGRFGGLLVAAFCFGLCNLFFQVPVSVVRIMAATSEQLAKIPPYEPSQIETNFSAWGLWVEQILPDLVLPNRDEAPEQPPLTEIADDDMSLSPKSPAELGMAASDLGDSDFDDEDLSDEDLGANEALNLELGSPIDASPVESEVGSDPVIDSESAQGEAEPALAHLTDSLSEDQGDVLEDALPLDQEPVDEAQPNTEDARVETSEPCVPVLDLEQTDAPQAVANEGMLEPDIESDRRAAEVSWADLEDGSSTPETVDDESEVSSLPIDPEGGLQSDSEGDEGGGVETAEIPAAPQEGTNPDESIAEVELVTDSENLEGELILEADTEDSATPSQTDEVGTPAAPVAMDSETGDNDDTLEVLQGEVTSDDPLEALAKETEDDEVSA